MNQAVRKPTDRNPKLKQRPTKPVDRNPKSGLPLSGPASELASQIAQLQEDLKRSREQLAVTESHKRQAEQEAEEAKEQISVLYGKYEDSQRQRMDLAALEDARIQELRRLSQERDRAWQSELDALQNQQSLDLSALGSAMSELQRLKLQLSKVVNSKSAYAEQFETAKSEILQLKQEMSRMKSIVENLKGRLRDSEQAKANAETVFRKTQHQLQLAKATVETLLSDGSALMESFNFVVSELEKSRSQEDLLEETVEKLQADRAIFYDRIKSDCLLKVKELMAALEAAEVKHLEEQIKSMVLIQSAHELKEKLRNGSVSREAGFRSELTDTEAATVALKAELSEKEAQLQNMLALNSRLQSEMRVKVNQMKTSLGSKLMRSAEEITDLKAKIKDKEIELRGVVQENELLKSKMRQQLETRENSEAAVTELRLARAKEQETAMKLEMATEELDASSMRASRLTEELSTAQMMKEEMEVELKRLRVQSEQWKKAAEAALALLANEKNNSFAEKLMKLCVFR